MSNPNWKFAQPTVMEDASNLTWARTSWTFAQPMMMIDATIDTEPPTSPKWIDSYWGNNV